MTDLDVSGSVTFLNVQFSQLRQDPNIYAAYKKCTASVQRQTS